MSLLPIDFGGPVDQQMTPFDYADLDQSVFSRFFFIATQYYDHVAIRDGAITLTYSQALSCVYKAAQVLSEALGPGTGPVAIALDHEARFPLLMLAVLATGRPYVPLDINFPAERNAHILAHSGAVALITDSRTLKGPRTFKPDAFFTHYALDAAGAGQKRPSKAPVLGQPNGRSSILPPAPPPDSPAYILYTSGSTGEPKGVVQSHRYLLHDIMQYTKAVHISPDDRLTQLYSASVNGAIRDVYGALLNGAELHILSLKKLGATGLVEAITAARITIYHSVPTVFRQVATAIARDNRPPDHVRLAYLAGDRLDLSDVVTFRQTFPRQALLYTGIGSTENATLYRHHFIAHDTPLDGDRLPVGRAIPDRRVRLIDDEGQDVTPGAIGEIEVTSRYMALGYLGQPFPVSPDDPDARVFRTGDLGRLRPDGQLEFHGRKDDQVKIRGHRVEPAAVEAALRALRSVKDGAIHVRRDNDVATAMIAYWVATPGHTGADILADLAERLPPAMVPAEAVRVPKLPLLDNFKTDRRALAAWDRALVKAARRETVSDDPALRRFQTACRDLLGRVVHLTDSLDDLRLDSLQWVQTQLVLETVLGCAVPADLIVTHGHLTLAELFGNRKAA